jgi:hypothetical protein
MSSGDSVDPTVTDPTATPPITTDGPTITLAG